jgi:hypothetical protein
LQFPYELSTNYASHPHGPYSANPWYSVSITSNSVHITTLSWVLRLRYLVCPLNCPVAADRTNELAARTVVNNGRVTLNGSAGQQRPLCHITCAILPPFHSAGRTLTSLLPGRRPSNSLDLHIWLRCDCFNRWIYVTPYKVIIHINK